MTTRPRKKTKPAGKAAAKKLKPKKASSKAAAKKAVSKAKKARKTRGAKPARRRKVVAAAKRDKPAASPQPRATDGRNLLTSARRPKAERPRGSARARSGGRRVLGKRNITRSAAAAMPAAAYAIRDFAPQDAAAVNAVALAAFEQFRGEYSDWPEFSRQVGSMASLAESGEVIVATRDDRIVGAAAYAGPNAPKPDIFHPAWPAIRLLVVDPAERGHGVGRMLTDECIRRARRDGACEIALHTSPIMQVALAMYLRSGFVLVRQCPPIFGVPYRIYLKHL